MRNGNKIQNPLRGHPKGDKNKGGNIMATAEGIYLSGEQIEYILGHMLPAMISLIGLGVLWVMERYGRG